MNKPLALRLAKRLVDSSTPLPDRANLIRQIKGSDIEHSVEALTYMLALLPGKVLRVTPSDR